MRKTQSHRAAIVLLIFVSLSFITFAQNLQKKIVAMVSGEAIYEKELIKLLEMRYGKDAYDALQEKVIAAALEELITFKIMEQNLRKVSKDESEYQKELERYKKRLFQLAEQGGLEQHISFAGSILEIIDKNSELKDKYANKLRILRSKVVLNADQRKELREIWQDIVWDRGVQKYVLKFIFQKYNMHPKVLSKRILLTSKLRLFVKKQIKSEQINKLIKEDSFALSGGLVKISHIMFHKIDPISRENFTDAQLQEIKKKLLQIRQEIKEDRSNFAELAQKYSEDKTSKFRGGNLGWVPRWTIFLEELAEKAYRLPKDKMSDIIETKYAYHIIWITDRREGKKLTDSEMKEEAIEQIITNEKEELLKEWLEKAKIERKM